MKVQELHIFDKYKQYFKYAEELEKLNPKVSYQIQYFVCKKLYNNKLNLTQNQMDFVNKKIQEMKNYLEISKKNNTSLEITKEEFSDYVENIFFNIDDEDRFNIISKKTVGGFKLVVDLIYVLENFGEVDNKWIEIRKYCKYKIIDYNKSLLNGKEPKRGEKDQDSDNDNLSEKEIENELNFLEEQNVKEELAERINKENREKAKDNEKSPEILRKKSDVPIPYTYNEEKSNQMKSHNVLNTQIPNQAVLEGMSLAKHFPSSYQQKEININRSIQVEPSKINNEKKETPFNIMNSSDINTMRNTQIFYPIQPQINTNRFMIHPQPNYNQYFISNPVNQDRAFNLIRNNNYNLRQNISPLNYQMNHQVGDVYKADTNIISNMNPNNRSPPRVNENIKVANEIKKYTEPGDSHNAKDNVEKKKDLFMIEKETQFSFPIDKYNKDYSVFKDIIKEHIKFCSYELDFQKIKESIEHIEKAIYYLKNIQNN